MSNFKFLEHNIDVSKILKQVYDNWDDWGAVAKLHNIGGDLNPYGFLPLTMAVVPTINHSPKDTELQEDTPWSSKYTEINQWLKDHNFQNHSRAAFFKLQPGHRVGEHIDEGTYYLTRDRYHLSLQGRYLYEVEGEKHIIEPGTLFWFDNKKYHSSLNVDTVDRITFVFDVPKSEKVN